MIGNEEQNPWTTLDSTVVYDNKWIRVMHENVLTPAGTGGIYGKVHYKNRAIGVIPIDHEGNTYLVGQYRYPLNEYSWEIPEGGGPFDEDPIEAAKRELLEETGLIAQKWEQFAKVHLSNSVGDEVGYLYVAQDLIQAEQQTEETEEIKVWKLPLAEAIQMAMTSKITDSLSVIGLLKLAILRKINTQ